MFKQEERQGPHLFIEDLQPNFNLYVKDIKMYGLVIFGLIRFNLITYNLYSSKYCLLNIGMFLIDKIQNYMYNTRIKSNIKKVYANKYKNIIHQNYSLVTAI